MHTEKVERAVILKTHYNTIMSGARFFGFPLVVLDSRVLLAEAPPVVLLAGKYAVSFQPISVYFSGSIKLLQAFFL